MDFSPPPSSPHLHGMEGSAKPKPFYHKYLLFVSSKLSVKDNREMYNGICTMYRYVPFVEVYCADKILFNDKEKTHFACFFREFVGCCFGIIFSLCIHIICELPVPFIIILLNISRYLVFIFGYHTTYNAMPTLTDS
jgi:hypothetical protein